ncbi:MAG: amidohydrolase family protein [Candidatus Helarchaeota archaeon]
MNENSENNVITRGLFLFLIVLLTSILAWITYGNLEGVLGMLSYLLIGILCIFPWIIPFIGIPLGLIDIFGYWGFRMYDVTLTWSHLSSTWLPLFYYWMIVVFSCLIQVFFMFLIINKISTPKPDPKTNLALINCKIIDGNRDSKVINDGVILIKNIVENDETLGLIVGVGNASEIAVPSGYKKIDLNGYYVLPGLINAHCHLFGTGKPTKLMALSDDFKKRIMGVLKTRFAKIIAMKLMMNSCKTALNAGVTTLRAMGDLSYLDVKLKKKIEEGKFLGPRLVVAGQPLIPTGGHGSYLGIIVDSKPEIRKAIRQNAREEVDCIKLISTGGVMDARMVGEAGRPQMTIEEIETACFEAHRAGLLVGTHCESTEGIKEALKGGVDSIDHGAEITDELVPLFKNNPKALRGYTTLTPTLSAGMGLATLPREVTKITEMSFKNAKLVEIGMIKGLQKAYKEGINIALGTDASVPYCTHYDVWKEVKYALHYTDMSAQEAIYFATKGSAECIGIDDITGSIEVGKSADLQVVPGNPLENIDYLGDVRKVIIRGHLIKNPKIKKIKSIEKNPITNLIEL